MNEEKAKILLRLYKEDLITADEFLILSKEPFYTNNQIPNLDRIFTQSPIFNQSYYTDGTGSYNSTSTYPQQINYK